MSVIKQKKVDFALAAYSDLETDIIGVAIQKQLTQRPHLTNPPQL